MKAIDANLILRYILKDDEKFYNYSCQVIDKEEIQIPGEILLEVVYVLLKVYKINRIEIRNSLTNILNYPNVTVYDQELIEETLSLFASENIDYADALLVAMNTVRKIEIETLDKKVKGILKKIIFSKK